MQTLQVLEVMVAGGPVLLEVLTVSGVGVLLVATGAEVLQAAIGVEVLQVATEVGVQ